MSSPYFSESIPLGKTTDIQIRSNILSPWKVTMTVTDGADVVIVDLNADDLNKLAITANMAINMLKETGHLDG